MFSTGTYTPASCRASSLLSRSSFSRSGDIPQCKAHRHAHTSSNYWHSTNDSSKFEVNFTQIVRFGSTIFLIPLVGITELFIP